MSDTMDRLRQLQTEMSTLAQKEKGLTAKPDDFAELDTKYQEMKQRIGALETTLDELQKKRRDLERDLQAEQELLKKYQGQLMQVKNQQQYAAAWKEIDTARKKVKDLEDEALKRMSEIEEAEKSLASVRDEFSPLEEEHRTAYDAWQGSLGDLREEVKSLQGKVAGIESGLPEAIRREFHAIYRQRQGVAVAVVQDSACSACRVRIRPQSLQQLKRGELARCESCRRYLVP